MKHLMPLLLTIVGSPCGLTADYHASLADPFSGDMRLPSPHEILYHHLANALPGQLIEHAQQQFLRDEDIPPIYRWLTQHTPSLRRLFHGDKNASIRRGELPCSTFFRGSLHPTNSRGCPCTAQQHNYRWAMEYAYERGNQIHHEKYVQIHAMLLSLLLTSDGELYRLGSTYRAYLAYADAAAVVSAPETSNLLSEAYRVRTPHDDFIAQWRKVRASALMLMYDHMQKTVQTSPASPLTQQKALELIDTYRHIVSQSAE